MYPKVYFVILKTPPVFTLTILSISSSLVSSKVTGISWLMPALLIKMRISPVPAAALRALTYFCCGSRGYFPKSMSTIRISILGYCALISDLTDSSFSRERDTRIRLKPFFARLKA